MEAAMKRLSEFKAELCSLDWDIVLSPVSCIGAIARLARDALRSEEAVTRVAIRFDEEDAAWDSDPGTDARPFVRHLIMLESLGWHVTTLRPNSTEPRALWCVSIARYDKNLIMTIPEAEDPDVGLEELVRYATGTAKECAEQ
jgi:hypothetical protein